MQAKFSLSVLDDGRMALLCDNHDIPKSVNLIEYFSEMKSFQLNYYSEYNRAPHLVEFELSEKAAEIVEKYTGAVFTLIDSTNPQSPTFYDIPFQKISR